MKAVRTMSRERGMSMLGVVAILAMAGFFVYCAIRMTPPYFEYLSVKDIISRLSMEPETKEYSTGQIRRTIATRFNTNQIYELESSQVEIYRKRGNTYIDAGYEVRLPIFWRIHAVLDFDDLRFQVGTPDPVEHSPENTRNSN